MCSFLEHDDEVIMFEPAFEFYFRQAEIFEGRVKFIPLTPPGSKDDEWGYDFDKIEKTITKKTRILMLNTPHNPTGKVLTEKEVDNFVQIAKKWPNLIIVSDEVPLKVLYFELIGL
jgi:kynurenine aminotransferase